MTGRAVSTVVGHPFLYLLDRGGRPPRAAGVTISISWRRADPPAQLASHHPAVVDQRNFVKKAPSGRLLQSDHTRCVDHARHQITGGGYRSVIATYSLPAWRARFATGTVIHSVALTELGRVEEAATVAEEELAWAHIWGTPRFVGIAMRGRAHTVGNPEKVAALQSSVAALEKAPARLELARALGDLGSTMRRQSQRVAALDPLRRALDLAWSCRADALADHLRGELRAAGARPRRAARSGRDSLTASESRVAEMAASGMTNHQIAQAIFLAPGTVEKHLTSVYAKLAVSSRHQLAGALMPIPPV